MKQYLTPILSLVTAQLFSMPASGAVAAVNVECQGNCDTITLDNACTQWKANSIPFAISCADTSDGPEAMNYSCGSAGSNAFCQSIPYAFGAHKIGYFCDDHNGFDAVVMCSDSAAPPYNSKVPAYTKQVRVECQGDCRYVQLGAACGSGWEAIAVGCDDIGAGGTPGDCGWGSAKCQISGNLKDGTRTVGEFCDDGAGMDTIVTCLSNKGQPNVQAVRVECNGDCNTLTLSSACKAATPLEITCKTPAAPTSTVTCGSGSGRCTYQPPTFGGSDLVGRYCQDDAGWDAIVMCEGQM